MVPNKSKQARENPYINDVRAITKRNIKRAMLKKSQKIALNEQGHTV
jgi:hypothetical protein